MSTMTAPAVRPSGRPPEPLRYRASARHRRYLVARDLISGAALLSVVGVIALWLLGGGLGDWSSAGGAASSLGRLTGLLSSVLLLLQVLLMARIPWVEQAYGQDVLTRWHRWVGFSSFALMLAHITLITIGYAEAAHAAVLGQLWDFTLNYPGMLLAVGGTAALSMVVVTSVRAARRRLRYASWHLLHLYAYLGVGLALPHQLWTGTDFTSSPVATVFWWGLWIAATAAIIGFRLLLPILRSARHRLVVDAVYPETNGVFSVVLRGRRLDRLGLQAGQFCQWRFLAGAGWSRAHPLTLSAPPGPTSLRITVREAGAGTARISRLLPGTRVAFEGPYGVLTADRRTHRDVLLIAAGVGVTPMRALAEQIGTEAPSPGPGGVRKPRITLLHRVSSPADAIFAAELADLQRTLGCRVVTVSGPRDGSSWLPAPHGRHSTGSLRRWVPGLASREVYLCGQPDWMRQVRRTLRDAGVADSATHSEQFTT